MSKLPKLGVVLLAGATALVFDGASAATSTTTFNVQLIITSECIAQSAANLNFGTDGVLAAAVDATSTLGVQCTSGTAYNVGLDEGGGSGATIAARRMTGPGAATITYSMYQNAGRTTLWGETIGTDTVAGTGNGAVQSYTVYGRVPAQTTPAAGTYTDTITVTVTY